MTVRFGLHLLTQLSVDHAIRYQELIEESQLAESLGFDSVWVGEHHTSHAVHLPPVPSLVGIASFTKKIKFGTAVLLLPLHHPLHVSEDFAFLDALSNGRSILGIGIGFRQAEFEAFNVLLRDRRSRFDEQVFIISKLLEENRVSFDGKFYKMKDVTMNIRCVQQPRLPIWIAVGGSAPNGAIEKSAKMGDAILADPIMNMDRVREVFTIYDSAVRQTKGTPRFFPVFRECVIAKTREEAEREAQRFIINKYMDYVKWKLPAIHSEFPDPNNVDYDRLKQRFIIGDKTDIIEQIERYRKQTQADYFVLRLHHIGMPRENVLEEMKMFSQGVLDYIT